MTADAELREGARAFTAIPGKYLSITSYRRDGTGVATPVWFVTDGRRLLVETDRASGKVKRIRRRASISIAPCSARGKLLGEQVPARAEVLPWEPDLYEPMFEQKYRVDLVFFRPIRAIQRALHLGPRGNAPVLLSITPE